MQVEGTVENGGVVLDVPTSQPDGTKVMVTAVVVTRRQSLLERLGDVVDHYLYGQPKR